MKRSRANWPSELAEIARGYELIRKTQELTRQFEIAALEEDDPDPAKCLDILIRLQESLYLLEAEGIVKGEGFRQKTRDC